MPKLKGRRWGLVVSVGLASALGCNAILGNEEGHLPSDEAGGDGNVSGAPGNGGKGSGGKGNSSGGVWTSTGGTGAGAPGNEAGAGGEPSGGTGGSPSATGGKSATGGTIGSGGKSATGGTFSSGGTGPATGGTIGRGGTTSTGGGPTPPGGAPSSGGAPAGCASTDPSSCPSASSVRYCDGGSYRTVACATRCPEIGFDGATAQCSSAVCMCGAALDPVCEQGANKYCTCAGGCTPAVFTAIYVNCFQGTDPTAEAATVCWASATDCTDGINRCGT